MGKFNLPPFLRSPTATSVLGVHDGWLNQSVTSTSDVKFHKLHATGSLIVDGDFTVLGTNNISESTIVKYKSHILIVNDGEMGTGVHLNEAGIEVDRGMLENVRIVFREADRSFRVGKISSAQAIATREDVPMDGGLMMWDSTIKSMKSVNIYPRDLRLSSTTPSTGIGTGAFVVDGVSSFASDLWVGGRAYVSGSSLTADSPYLSTTPTNTLQIVSPSDVAFSAENVSLPSATPLWFGDAVAVYAETVGGVKDLYISTNESGRVRIPSVQDATTKTIASMVLQGGISIGRTVLLGGDDTDYAIWATESNTLKIHSRNPRTDPACPTKVCIMSNTLAPNTELQIGGPVANGHLSLKFEDTRFLIQPSSSSSDLELSAKNRTAQFVIRADGTTTMAGQLTLPLSPPSADEHAVSKLHLDNTTGSFACKKPVRVATTFPGILSDYVSGAVVDGVVLQSGDRVFVKDAIDQTINGIWVVVDVASLPTRPVDFKQGFSATGSVIFVAEGVTNASSGWVCTAGSQADKVGTDPLAFTRFTGLGAVVAGAGLTKSANTMNANVDDFSLEISADTIRLSNTGVSTGLVGGSGTALAVKQNIPHVTEVGTLTGVSEWHGKTIETLYGGTGRTSFNMGSLVYGTTGALADDVRLVWNGADGVLAVDGNISVTGTLNGGIQVTTSDIVLSGAVNCSATVYKAECLRNGSRVTLSLSLEAIPTLSHTRTSVQFTLPNKLNDVANRMDVFCIGTGICELDQSAGIDGVVNIENIFVASLTGTKRACVVFTCNEAGKLHQFYLQIKYSI